MASNKIISYRETLGILLISFVIFCALQLAGVFTIVSSAEAASTTDTFKTTEVKGHNTASDCWTIIDSKVYDFTSLLAAHPSGHGVTAAALCGVDATTLWNSYSSHSTSDKSALAAMQQGIVDDTTTETETTETNTTTPTPTPIITGKGKGNPDLATSGGSLIEIVLNYLIAVILTLLILVTIRNLRNLKQKS